MGGEPVVRTLGAGEAHTFRLDLDAGAFRVVVEQRGIDVALAVEGPGGERFGVDGPFDRVGEERLLLEPTTASSWRLEVRAREPGRPPAGTVIVRVEAVVGARLVVERAWGEAGRRYLEGGPEGRRDALAAYRRAFEAEAAAADDRGAARALYAVAVLHRLLDETAAGVAAAEEAASRWATLGDGAAEAYARAEVGLDRWLLGDVAAAREAFGTAVGLHDAAGDPFGTAAAAANLCLLDLVGGELRRGVACYEEALPRLRAAGAASLLAAAEVSLGRAYDILGEPALARGAYEAALERQRATSDRLGEAQTLNNLALLDQELGDVDRALAGWDRALGIFRELDRRRWVARVLGNLGFAYGRLGDPARGEAFLREALPLWREVDDPRGEAMALVNAARAAAARGGVDVALALEERARERFAAAGDRRGEAIAWVELGRIRVARGELAAADEAFAAALARLAGTGDAAGEAAARIERGRLRLAGDVAAGRADFEVALDLARGAGNPELVADALLGLASAERAAGRLEAAVARAEEAIASVETVRSRIGSPELRATFGGLHHAASELLVDLRMSAHDAAPADGWDRKALAAAEAARSRSLVELLRESRIDPASAVDPALGARRRALLDRLDAKASRAGSAPEATRRILAAEQAEVLHELDLVEAEVRRASPAFAELVEPAPLDVAAIQGLLDPDTLLLVYALGEARSFVWAVTPESVRAHVLAPRATLEEAVRRLHEALARPDPADREDEARWSAELATTLLGPVADLLDRPRLAIVADGALHYLPFAALPEPGGGWGSSLLDRHELVHPPSASAVAAARGVLAGRRPASRRALLLADPVLGGDDPRIAGGAGGQEATAARSGRDARGPRASPGAGETPADGSELARLPASGDEARAIAELAPPGEAVLLLGPDASRARALSGELRGFGAVHFATHGVLDTEHPALSGLALSSFDADGRPQAGFLRLADVYPLRLDADLVVLSGCRTALGRELRGEGLVGLVRGFLHAGARAVVASLWRVDDRATAALMPRFYRAYWAGRSPAAALREAQLELKRERRTRDPAAWAAFVVVGDWRWSAGAVE